MEDPKELNDIGLENLWILSPALRQLVPFYVGVKRFDLVLAGGNGPAPGSIEIPFTYSDQLNELFEKMMGGQKPTGKN